MGGTTIPLSMKKKVKISMTNPPYRGKPRKISNDEGDPANRFQSRDHHPPLHAKKSRKIHGYLPQQQPHIETLKKYLFSNDHQRKDKKTKRQKDKKTKRQKDKKTKRQKD